MAGAAGYRRAAPAKNAVGRSPIALPRGTVRAHGEAGWTARLVPLTVDGLIFASSMVLLDSARRKAAVPALARRLLGLGIAATLAANVAHGMGHGLIGAPWPHGRQWLWSCRMSC